MKLLFEAPPVLKRESLILRPLESSDSDDLNRLTQQEIVYRFLPTFLFEKKYEAPANKVSVGYRLLSEKWGKGIATEARGLLIQELLKNKGIEIITASTMIENRASARVLEKNGFTLVCHAALEDWGYPEPTTADKWII